MVVVAAIVAVRVAGAEALNRNPLPSLDFGKLEKNTKRQAHQVMGERIEGMGTVGGTI